MRRKTVVVLDDDPIFRTLVKKILEDEGLIVHQAASPEECEALLDRVRPSLLIMDEVLADGSGADWLRKRRAEGMNMPVMLAGDLWHQDDEPPAIVKELGIELVTHKPLNPSSFRTEVMDLLATRKDDHPDDETAESEAVRIA